MNNIVFAGTQNTCLAIGNKAELLNNLVRMKIQVPDFFVIPSQRIRELLPLHALDSLWANTDDICKLDGLAEDLAKLCPADFIVELQAALNKLDTSPAALFAVRSSGMDEDTKNASMAGQYESKVFVPEFGVLSAILQVWLSGLNAGLTSYRQAIMSLVATSSADAIDNLALPRNFTSDYGQNFPQDIRGDEPVARLPQLPSVIVQKMVLPRTAGVIFSVNPVSLKNEIVIEAVLGHGHGLVTGELDADHWRIDGRNKITTAIIANKQSVYYFDVDAGSGLVKRSVDVTAAKEACLSPAQIQILVKQTRFIARHCGFAVDIEWAWSDEKLYILQVRPITGGLALSSINSDQLSSLPRSSVSPEHSSSLDHSSMVVYDNSNIAESYPGVTTVLTYSFAAYAYEHVYRTFCRELGVPGERLARQQQSLQSMLALIRGRMYYNLNSWYSLLSLLPGYDLNRGFMEGMMGVGQSFNPVAAQAPARANLWAKCSELLIVLKSVVLLLWNFWRQKSANKAFSVKVKQVLASSRSTDESLPSLLAGYYQLEEQLLCNWRAPINNDFFCMILFGLFKRLCGNWLKDEEARLQPALLFLGEGLVSNEPFHVIQSMARQLKEKPDLIRILCESDSDLALMHLRRDGELSKLFDEYIEKFGCRCLEELKLETVTLKENPEALLRIIGNVARKMCLDQELQASKKIQADKNINEDGNSRMDMTAAYRQACCEVRSRLKSSPLKLKILFWVHARLAYSLRSREELRFLRTLVFGRVRQIYLALGCCFTEAGILEEPRDVFHLTRQEVFDLAEGRLPYGGIVNLVNQRRQEYENNCAACDPPGRLALASPLLLFSLPYSELECSQAWKKAVPLRQMKGLGCSAGVVSGRVKLVSDPSQARVEAGDIIVARHTDPGWVLILPAAAGLIVEYGGTLSHAAIVARELGVPCVVGIKEATLILKDGDYVSIDGSSGLVVVEKNNNVEPEQDAA